MITNTSTSKTSAKTIQMLTLKYVFPNGPLKHSLGTNLTIFNQTQKFTNNSKSQPYVSMSSLIDTMENNTSQTSCIQEKDTKPLSTKPNN